MEEFVAHFNFLDEISSSISHIEKDFCTISELYSVVRHYQIDVSEEQNAIYRIIFMKFNQLKTSMKVVATSKEASLTKFRNSLEAYIASLRVDVSNLKDKVRAFYIFYYFYSLIFIFLEFFIFVSCNTVLLYIHFLWNHS